LELGDGGNSEIDGGGPSAAYKIVGHCSILLEKLKELASPSIFVRGHAFLRGLQNQQPTEMASLLLHMLAHLLSTLGKRIAE
jgi:hypothetical protein